MVLKKNFPILRLCFLINLVFANNFINIDRLKQDYSMQTLQLYKMETLNDPFQPFGKKPIFSWGCLFDLLLIQGDDDLEVSYP